MHFIVIFKSGGKLTVYDQEQGREFLESLRKPWLKHSKVASVSDITTPSRQGKS